MSEISPGNNLFCELGTGIHLINKLYELSWFTQ
jgi:hypothetical protein